MLLLQKFSKAKAITELVSEIASLERELKVFADSTLEEIHDVRFNLLADVCRNCYLNVT